MGHDPRKNPPVAPLDLKTRFAAASDVMFKNERFAHTENGRVFFFCSSAFYYYTFEWLLLSARYRYTITVYPRAINTSDDKSVAPEKKKKVERKSRVTGY